MKIIAAIRVTSQINENEWETYCKSYEVGDSETAFNLFQRVIDDNKNLIQCGFITISQLFPAKGS